MIELAVAIGTASIVFWAVEVEKWVKRRSSAAAHGAAGLAHHPANVYDDRSLVHERDA